MNKTIVTITGPSASGKSVLESKLCDQDGSIFEKVTSHTTRVMRAGERYGRDYYFVTPEQFRDINRADGFVETIQFGDNSYGAHKNEFERIFSKSKIAVVVCEPKGRAMIEKYAINNNLSYVSVFVTNPPEVRFERLLDRFMRDIEHLELGGEQMRARKRAFADRLAMVYTTEHLWEEDAWLYDATFTSFGESNTAAVVNHVSALAMNAMSRPIIRNTQTGTRTI